MKPSLLLAGLVLLAAPGCKKPSVVAAAPEVEPSVVVIDPALRRLHWVTHSGQGAEVRQVAQAPGACTVTCAPRAGTGWTRQGCLGLETDFRFVADDCGQLVVLYEYPELEGARADLVVGVVVAPEKEPVRLRLSKFMQSFTALQLKKRHVMWLGGVLGTAGNAPRLSPDGTTVQLETIDKVPHALTFAAFGAWVDKGPTVDPAAVHAEGGLYQWEDAAGSIHVGSLAQVPARYRSKAIAIEAEVMVMSNDHRAAPATSDPVEPNNWRFPVGTRPEDLFKAAKEPSRNPGSGSTQPSHDEYGRPIGRNELGEDHLQYVNRLSEAAFNHRHGFENRDVNDRTTPVCRVGGAACSNNQNCCSGNCAKQICN